MTKNLETADLVVKLLLALTVVILYMLKVISGPSGRLLMILGLLSIVIFTVKALVTVITRD